MTSPAAPTAAPALPSVFPEHRLAHELLDGLSGLEVGAAAHNPFGLSARNVATREGWEFYAREQQAMGVEPAPVDVWGSGDAIPVPDQSEDFVLSSHVVEHLPNPIAAFVEWHRVVKDGGYVFMIVPIKGVLPEDGPRELTTLEELVACYRRGYTVESHPIDGVPGGRMGHYHTFTPDSLTDLVDWMREQRLCDWELVAREDVDSKVGNGFTLAFRVHHQSPA
jgi:SAM-dependent methyltransferase